MAAIGWCVMANNKIIAVHTVTDSRVDKRMRYSVCYGLHTEIPNKYA